MRTVRLCKCTSGSAVPLGLPKTQVSLATGSQDAGIAAIVARTPLVETARAIAAEFRSQIAAFGRVSATSEDEIIEGVERNLLRWSKWAASGVPPADSDFDPLREWARARANEGVRLEDLLRAFGLGSQICWHLIRRNARSDEADVLLDAADLIMQYVNRMSAVVTDTYLAERELLVSEDERRTRKLLDRLTNDLPLDASHHELAARLGVPVEAAYVPFAIVMPERTSRHHAALAARLRGRGSTLTATEGDRVVGLTTKPLDLIDLEGGSDVILAIADLTPRQELAEARDELVRLAERGRRLGLRGRMRAEDHLLEVLVGRSPRMATRLRARVLAPLADSQHGELLRTLHTLVSCDFDRAATSAALHVHRNTLAYRLKRIEEITGLDLDDPRVLALVYLASSAGVEQ